MFEVKLGVNQIRGVVESMNILSSTFQNFIYFQVDSNLLFLYTHLPTNTHPPLHYTNARLGSIKNYS